jgi:acetyltransferase-like isoleucine patch superfamily enzyme
MLGAGAVVIRDVALGATVGSVLAREWSRSPATPEQSERLA